MPGLRQEKQVGARDEAARCMRCVLCRRMACTQRAVTGLRLLATLRLHCRMRHARRCLHPHAHHARPLPIGLSCMLLTSLDSGPAAEHAGAHGSASCGAWDCTEKMGTGTRHSRCSS